MIGYVKAKTGWPATDFAHAHVSIYVYVNGHLRVTIAPPPHTLTLPPPLATHTTDPSPPKRFSHIPPPRLTTPQPLAPYLNSPRPQPFAFLLASLQYHHSLRLSTFPSHRTRPDGYEANIAEVSTLEYKTFRETPESSIGPERLEVYWEGVSPTKAPMVVKDRSEGPGRPKLVALYLSGKHVCALPSQ